jgi:hypothetical protein
MPVSLKFSEPAAFVLDASGTVTYSECHEVLGDLAVHPSFSSGARVLADARSVIKAPSAEELRALVQDLRPLLDRGVRSLGILTGTTAVYGVARMFATFAEALDFDVPVFKTLSEAQQWMENGESSTPA